MESKSMKQNALIYSMTHYTRIVLKGGDDQRMFKETKEVDKKSKYEQFSLQNTFLQKNSQSCYRSIGIVCKTTGGGCIVTLIMHV